MKTLKNILPKAAVIFLIFTMICGIVYTGVVTGIAQLIFPDKANGSIIEVDGKKYGCELLGQQYTDDAHILDYIELDEEHAIFEISVPNGWVGKTIGQLDIRKKYDINIMALKHNGAMNLRISPDTSLPKNDTMLVLGDIKSIQKCFHI